MSSAEWCDSWVPDCDDEWSITRLSIISPLLEQKLTNCFYSRGTWVLNCEYIIWSNGLYVSENNRTKPHASRPYCITIRTIWGDTFSAALSTLLARSVLRLPRAMAAVIQQSSPSYSRLPQDSETMSSPTPQQTSESTPSPAPQQTSKFIVLDNTQVFEEEQFEWYTPTQFYSVRIEEVFNDRYQVIGKLGYGAYSTVWLCRDLKYKSLHCAIEHLLTAKQRKWIRNTKGVRV